ncbi:hypothetical protein PROFUN_06637 [Planoprotostelium fungivorum]|uniref:Potassium channel tetramerisation-type BTB domain-containing protein n=1 Tax=Planoprotostelium fungivorum TaxID=1890364 RepID=A0A2P6MSW1_9EUKA|nr:hypothetical protein PROFUN_06637 [Planoprotostelium fungivorum]
MEAAKTEPEIDRVEFLVGDEIFSLNRADVQKHQPNLLSMLLSNEENDRMKVEKDNHGRIIIRRAATFFPAVVTWLESSKVLGWIKEEIRKEADYYNLSEMVKAMHIDADEFPRFDGAYFPSDTYCSSCGGRTCTQGHGRIVFQKEPAKAYTNTDYKRESSWERSMVGVRFQMDYRDAELLPSGHPTMYILLKNENPPTILTIDGSYITISSSETNPFDAPIDVVTGKLGNSQNVSFWRDFRLIDFKITIPVPEGNG